MKNETKLHIFQNLTIILISFAISIGAVIFEANRWIFYLMITIAHISYWFMLYETEKEFKRKYETTDDS